MPANECTPFKEPGATFTARCSAAVSGCRFVSISGDRTGGGGGGAEGAITVGVGLSTDAENIYKVKLGPSAAGAIVGVSGYDGPSGGEIKVYAIRKGIVLPIKAAEAIAAGEEVMSNAEGEAVKYVEGANKKALGLTMTKVASGGQAEILLH